MSDLPASPNRPVFAAWAALAATLVFAGACSQTSPAAVPATTTTGGEAAGEEGGPSLDATIADHGPFPEVCGAADDPLVCGRVPLDLPDGTVLSGPVAELGAVERVVGGSEVRIAARTARGWAELPFVLASSPPMGGDAHLGRVVEARTAGPVLALRVQSAVREHANAGSAVRELEENVWLCTFSEPQPACTRVRTARGATHDGLAEARWTAERVLRVHPSGRLVLEQVSPPATR